MRIDDGALAHADVRDLIADHLAQMHEVTPEESVHALGPAELGEPAVRVWAARDDDGRLLGIAALKDLGGAHAELKSMRTAPAATRRGVGAALLRHLLDAAVAAGAVRISLETGAEDFFAPARRLYVRHGFVECPPFGAYAPDPLSTFMTLDLGPGALRRRLIWRGRVVAWDAVGAGPPVVLCHGTPWSARLWDRVAADLSRDHTVYRWDMPGYGASSKDLRHPVDLGVQGELLADLLETWGLDRPRVVAHDIGGAVALRAHLLHGAAYASLGLVDVVALWPWGSPFFRLVQEHADVFERLPPAIHRGALAAYVGGASHRGLSEADLEMLLAPWLDAAGLPAFYRQIAQADESFTDGIEPRYADLDLPVQVVWGTEDTWIPVDRAHRLAATIPGAELRLVPDAGHLIHLDAPDTLAEIVGDWVRRERPEVS